MDFEATRKKWRVLTELSNNKTNYDVVTMTELTGFIGKERQKSRNAGGVIRKLTPVEPWLLDIAFRRFEKAFSKTEVISVEIYELPKKKEVNNV